MELSDRHNRFRFVGGRRRGRWKKGGRRDEPADREDVVVRRL